MKFDLTAFEFLNGEEYNFGWENLGQSDLDAVTETLLSGDLQEEAGDIISTVDAFFSTLDKMKPAVVGEYDASDLLSIHADEMGLLDVVLGPAIFKDEDGNAVIKTGSNLFSLSIDGSTAKCGNLEGDIEVVEIGDDDHKILVVAMDCLLDSSDETLNISFILDGDENNKPTKGAVKKAIKSGTLASLLKKMPSGGGYTKMNHLIPQTEYSVVSVEERPVHEKYGRSWLITVEGLGGILSKGKRFEKGLAQNAGIYKKMLAAGKPLTLLVSSITEIPSGVQVKAGFFKRAPRPQFAYKPEIKNAALPVTETKELAPAIDVKSAEVSEEDLMLV